jgi:hypothetical protein
MHDYHATLQPASPSFPSSSPQTSIEKKKKKKKQGTKPEIKPETPSKSVPNYTKTMHAFTLNQLNYIHNTGCSHNQTHTKPATNNITSTAKRSTSTPNPFLPITSPLALKLPLSQSRTQYLSRSLSALNQMSLDEEPCGPSNTPEPGEGHSPPPPSILASRSVLKAVAPDEDVDLNGDGDSETATSPMFSMSPTEMLAQGRELEARVEALVKSRSGAGGNGDEGSSSRGGELEFRSSEAKDSARFRSVL